MIDGKDELDTVFAQAGGHQSEAGIVDQDVEREVLGEEFLRGLCDGPEVGQVEEEKVEFRVEVRSSLGQVSLEAFNGVEGLEFISAGEEDVCTLCGEGEGSLVAEPGASSGDDGDF